MLGKSEVVNIHSRKHYPIRPKIPQQHYHGNGYTNTHFFFFFIVFCSPVSDLRILLFFGSLIYLDMWYDSLDE
jgi:hypothetical protein